MALVPTGNPLWIPNGTPSPNASGSGTRNGTTLDTAGDYECFVLEVEDVDGGRTVDRLDFSISSVTAAGEIKAQLVPVGDDGVPDPLSPLAEATVNVTSAGWYSGTFGTPYVVSDDERIGLNLYRDTGTANVTVGWFRRTMWTGFAGLPYLYRFTGSATRLFQYDPQADRCAVAAHCNDGGWLSTPATPFRNSNLTTFTNGDEYGVRFTVPWDCVLSKLRWGTNLNSTFIDDVIIGDANYVAGDSGATVLSTSRFHYAVSQQSSDGTADVGLTPTQLSKNTVYHLAIRPTNAGNRFFIRWTNDSGNPLPNLATALGYPVGFQYQCVTAAGGGDWAVESSGYVPHMALGITQINDSGNGGGGGNAAHAARNYGGLPGSIMQ